MTEKELRKLGRVELLKLLLEQSKENQTLREQLQTAEKALADKTLHIDQAGSIAEASLQLSGVFQAAEEACRQYTENVKQLSQRQESICAQREKESQEQAARILAEARQQAEETTAVAQKQCAEMLEKAKTESQQCWNAISEKITTISNEHAELRHLLSQVHAQNGNAL